MSDQSARPSEMPAHDLRATWQRIITNHHLDVPQLLWAHNEIKRLQAEVDRWKLLLTVPHAVVPEAPVAKPFDEAEIGDHAYTWEHEEGHGFGEYRFETAGDPRAFYDDGCAIVRKRWVLIERKVLP